MHILVLSITVSVILYHGLTHSAKFVTMKSGYRNAIQFLKEQDGEKHLSGTNSVSEFYFTRNGPNLLKGKRGLIEDLKRENFKYLLTDFTHFNVPSNKSTEVYRYLFDHKEPVAIFDNPIGTIQEVVLENLHYRDDLGKGYKEVMEHPETSRIQIYETEDLLEELIKLK